MNIKREPKHTDAEPFRVEGSTWPELRFLCGIYMLALAVRLAFVLMVGRADLSYDEIEYHMLGANLADGNGYRWFFGLPTAFRPPGYPFLLAALYWFVGPDYFVARLVQSFLAGTVGVLTYLLGRELFDRRVARLGAVFVSLYPPLVVHSLALMTESIFIPLLLLSLWLLVHPLNHKHMALTWLASIVFAVAVLMRPTLSLFIFVIMFWILWREPHRKTALVRCGVFLLVLIVAVTPWCIRNYNLTGKFTYLDTQTGYNLYIGYRDNASGSLDLPAIREMFDAMIEQQLGPALGKHLSNESVYHQIAVELRSYKEPGFPKPHPDMDKLNGVMMDAFMNDWGTAKALEFIKENPWTALQLVPRKLAHFWNLEHRIFVYAYSNNMLGALPAPLLALVLLLILGPFVALTLAGVWGAVFRTGKERHLFLIFSLIGYYSLMHSVTFGEARFHYVLIPFIALFAASGMVHAKRIVGELKASDSGVRTRARRRLVAALVCCAGFIGIWTFGIHDSWGHVKAIFGPNGNKTYMKF